MTNSIAQKKDSGESFRYLGTVTMLYVTMQLVSDVTAGKIVALSGFTVSVTALYFPVTYIISDILTEVYGYARARRVLWTVLLCSVSAGLIYQIAVALPPAPGFSDNNAYTRVLGQVPRVLLGGWIAVFAGDISNNYVLAKLKVRMRGRHLWIRTISSTVVGQFLNTAAFYFIALYGILPTDLLLTSIISGWIIKVGVEVLCTPMTYLVIGWLKNKEGVDVYDHDTDFNPLRF